VTSPAYHWLNYRRIVNNTSSFAE